MEALSAFAAFFKSRGQPKYFMCSKDRTHQNETLNYVCIKRECERRGLFCSMCKTDHINHDIIPLKMLLGELQSHTEKPLSCSEGFQTELSKLERMRSEMLSSLK
jgi:hypothetical protein